MKASTCGAVVTQPAFDKMDRGGFGDRAGRASGPVVRLAQSEALEFPARRRALPALDPLLEILAYRCLDVCWGINQIGSAGRF